MGLTGRMMITKWLHIGLLKNLAKEPIWLGDQENRKS